MGLYAVAATQLVFRLIHTFDRSNLDTVLQKRNPKARKRGANAFVSLAHALGYQKFTARPSVLIKQRVNKSVGFKQHLPWFYAVCRKS